MGAIIRKLRIGNGLRPNSVRGFLESLPIVFQRGQAEGISARYQFTFTGEEELKGTVVITGQAIEVLDGHVGAADMSVTAIHKPRGRLKK